MKKEIILILTLVLLLIISFIAFSNKPIISGQVKDIRFNTNLVSFHINNTDILLFTSYLNIKENDSVQIYGKYDENNKSVIIADRIEKTK